MTSYQVTSFGRNLAGRHNTVTGVMCGCSLMSAIQIASRASLDNLDNQYCKIQDEQTMKRVTLEELKRELV